MNVDTLTNAIVSGINSGAEQFLEGTLAAVLPVIWLALLGLHLGRPYILDMIDRFTLRLGADLLWLIYIALRDFRLVTWFLAVGALFYFVPYLFGVMLNQVATGGFLTISNFLVSNTNATWAVNIGYISTALFAIMGAIAVGYVLLTGGRAEVPETTSK